MSENDNAFHQLDPDSEVSHRWLAAEAAGDEELAELLVERELLLNRLLGKMGDEPEAVRPNLELIVESIRNRKQELGINSSQTPSAFE